MATIGGYNVVTDGLVLSLDAGNRRSYVSGSGTWFDVSGNSSSGSLINGPGFNSNNGGSIQFDGVNDFVLLTNVGVTNLPAFSIAFWAKTTNGALYPTLYSEGTPSSWPANLFIIYYGDTSVSGKLRVWLGSTNALIGITDVRNSGWKYVTYIQSSTSSRSIYLNTILESSNITNLTNNAIRTSIGAHRDTGADVQFFNGDLSLLMCYNRALTESEMLQNYNAQKGRFGL